MTESGEKYISLKEAARLSGYSPDYVGQLIRKGKLPGKQIYSNIAWVTTEEAIKKYMEGSLPENGGEAGAPWLERKAAILEKKKLFRRVTILLRVILSAMIFFAIVLFYVFTASVEQRLEQRALRQAEVGQEKMK
ncbi:MAG: hypothetical protein AAB495_03310 [Patescibacteria group bacterium]